MISIYCSHPYTARRTNDAGHNACEICKVVWGRTEQPPAIEIMQFDWNGHGGLNWGIDQTKITQDKTNYVQPAAIPLLPPQDPQDIRQSD